MPMQPLQQPAPFPSVFAVIVAARLLLWLFDFSRLIGCGSSSLRPACSIRRLLPTPPRGDAVGAVFGREQFNSTDRTFTCVVASSTGVHDAKSAAAGSEKGFHGSQTTRLPAVRWSAVFAEAFICETWSEPQPGAPAFPISLS